MADWRERPSGPRPGEQPQLRPSRLRTAADALHPCRRRAARHSSGTVGREAMLRQGVTSAQRMLNPLFGAQLPRTRARLCSFDLTSTPISYGVAVSCARARPVAISARRLCRRCQLDGHLRVRTATAGTPAA